MKKIVAVILLSLVVLFMFTACKQEGEMIETMVSSIFSTENRTDSNNATASSGIVTDDDGHIGNENEEKSTAPYSSNNSETTNISDDNVI